MSETRKPNILLIQADQMAAHALPIYGNVVVKGAEHRTVGGRGHNVRKRLLRLLRLGAVCPVAIRDARRAPVLENRGL